MTSKIKSQKFRDAKIPNFEADILQEIEKLTKIRFTFVDKVKYDTSQGFSTENQQITGIGLYKRRLTTLPESIWDLQSLKKLVLYKNNLTTLPESIGNSASLQELRLQYNKLTKIKFINFSRNFYKFINNKNLKISSE